MGDFYIDLPIEGGGDGGITSINADTTAAQLIVGADSITVDTVDGTTTIGGGGSDPGGADTQVQYNSSGAFAGSPLFALTFPSGNPLLTLGDGSGTNPAFIMNSDNAHEGGIYYKGSGGVFGSYFRMMSVSCIIGVSSTNITFNSGNFIQFGNTPVLAGADNSYDFGITNASALVRFRDAAISGAWAPGGYIINSLAVSGGSDTVGAHISYYHLAPALLMATYTITMPASPIIGQILTFACPINGATTLTLSPNSGQTLYGAITTLTAGLFASYQFVSNGNSWIRIG